MIDKLIEHATHICMVVFPVSPYFNQYLKLKSSNQGFSLHVSGGIMLSAVFKMFFWYCKRFDTTILIQSIAMFSVQFWLLTVSKSSIHIKRRYPYTDVEVLGIFVYVLILTVQLIALIICQIKMGTEPFYVETIGFLGVALEAAVPAFQVLRNFLNQSVKGFSELVLLVWFTGDVCKIGYHLYFNNPMQFVICGIVQVVFDTTLFYQFDKYGKGIYGFIKEAEEQRRLLSEDPTDYYQNEHSYYDRYNNPSYSQFEAKPSHQRYLAEGTIYENDYDEAIMDPKPQITSKPISEDPANMSFSSIASKKINPSYNNINNNGNNNIAIDIQDEDYCPSEIERPSYHNSISSYRSYQYANIRNSNYYINQQHPHAPPQSIKNREEYDPFNSLLSINSHSRRSSTAGDIIHEITRKSSFTSFTSQNSSIYNTETIPDEQSLIENSNKSLNRSKSVHLPRNQLRPFNNLSNRDRKSVV